MIEALIALLVVGSFGGIGWGIGSLIFRRTESAYLAKRAAEKEENEYREMRNDYLNQHSRDLAEWDAEFQRQTGHLPGGISITGNFTTLLTPGLSRAFDLQQAMQQQFVQQSLMLGQLQAQDRSQELTFQSLLGNAANIDAITSATLGANLSQGLSGRRGPRS